MIKANSSYQIGKTNVCYQIGFIQFDQLIGISKVIQNFIHENFPRFVQVMRVVLLRFDMINLLIKFITTN